MVKARQTVEYRLEETNEFRISCAALLSAQEILKVGEMVLANPLVGSPLVKKSEAIKRLRYPADGRTVSGNTVYVIYCVDPTASRVVMIDVVEDGFELQEWLSDPNNIVSLMKYSKAIVQVISGLPLE